MPSIFSRSKKSTALGNNTPQQQPGSPLSEKPPPPSPRGSYDKSNTSSPEKKSKSNLVKEREKKDKRPKSPRHSKSYTRSRRTTDENEHPLNFYPDDPRRLSALSAMSSSQEGGGALGPDPMEMTPAPETPVAFSEANGANGEQHDSDGSGSAPAPPPHRSPASPPPPPEKPEKPAVDAEACKAMGNKFYKAQQYEQAIEEYTKGEIWFGLVLSAVLD